MKKTQIVNYIKEDNKEIIDFIKESSITNNNEANKLKNILAELKEIEKEYLIPIVKSKKNKYLKYKEVQQKEKDIRDKADLIKSLISNKLTEWNDSLIISNRDGDIIEAKIITNNIVKRYLQIEIEVVDINEVDEKYITITKILKYNDIKKEFKENHQQIKGLKITEREVIK